MRNLKNIWLMLFLLVCTFNFVSAQISGKVNTEENRIKYKENTVVYIENAKGTFNPPSKNVVMNQKNLVFIPHVLPVVAGTTVDFLNSDDVLHNVFSPDKCCKFDLGTYAKGVSKSQKFDKAGSQAVLLCNVHPEMEAYVVVLQNPYFALTDKEGNFKIENVPAGNYTLKVWNEKLRGTDQSITVPSSGKLVVSFDLIK